MGAYTIHPLVVGANETDQGVMTYLKGYGRRIWIPIYVFYVAGGEKKILVDTGLDQFVVPPEVGEENGVEILEFEDALATVGLEPEDVDIIVHTHLHNDHCENDYKCPNAKVYVQKTELDFFRDPHPIDHRYYPDLLDDVEVVTVDGEAEIIDGIQVVPSPGHTPGTQSVLIQSSQGKVGIAGFCCNQENFPEKGPAVAPGVHTDALAAYESIQQFREMADILLPLHDFSVGQRKQIP
jgi:glyoxylase-like metal-dependent hydrolase (beta-lactamase superfamily II)